MDAPAPGPDAPKAGYLTRPIPLKVGLPLLALIIALLGLAVVLPIRDQARTVRRIEELGGLYDHEPGGPGWLRSWLGDERMSSFDAIVDVNLRNTKATDETLEELRSLPTLKWVDLSGTRITDSGLAALGRILTLQSVDLSDNNITDAGLNQLAGLVNLRDLNLRGTRVTREEAERFRSAHPRLRMTR